jgi:hypothetical protein
MKKWSMRDKTREIVSESTRLCKEMNETYDQKVTVRQIYYHLFSKGIIKLNLRDYHKVCNILTVARLRGFVSFEWIEDRSRRMLGNMLYSNAEHFLDSVKNRFRKNTWGNQENFVIILIEKEALAQIVWDIAEAYNVFVFPTKGFSSWSMFTQEIKSVVECFGRSKKLIVLVLSDLDPSGGYIKEDYENKFRFMVKEMGFPEPRIVKIAITEEQIEEYDLPPMKKNYRNKGIMKIWELDALPPKAMREIVRKAIESNMDLEELRKDRESEKNEKEQLQILIDNGIEEYTENIGEDR